MVDSKTQRSMRRQIFVGVLATAIVVGGVGSWAATTEFAGAVIAPGHVVVDSNVKKIQHPTGGVVGQVNVRDGDRVEAGKLLVRLDDTVTRANLMVITKTLDELYARQARLLAERDGVKEITFPDELQRRAGEPEIARIMASERRLFSLRQTARETQKAQLAQRVEQLREEIAGLEGQTKAKRQEIELIGKELVGVRDLARQNLVPVTRVNALDREGARLEGDRGRLQATIAQAKGRITETELQILQIDQDLRSEVAGELREIDGRTAELTERKVAAEDQLKRTDIFAPYAGTVHQLAVHTIGGVIGPAEPLMLIVPNADALTIEARVAPQDIDQVQVGQEARLRFSAFNQRNTPELSGKVSRIAADLIMEERTQTSYYTIRIALPPEELARLGGLVLVPGMPVEAFVQTGQRTVLSYIAKPLADHMQRAFREE